jgi:hypothetical protein
MLTRASLPCPRHPPPRILRQGQILTALRDATDLMTLADIATAVDQWLHHTVRDGASCRKSASRWRSRRMRLTGSLRQSALPPRRGRSATARFSSRRSRGCYAHAKRSDLVTMIRQADIVGMASASWLNAVETFFTKLTRAPPRARPPAQLRGRSPPNAERQNRTGSVSARCRFGVAGFRQVDRPTRTRHRSEFFARIAREITFLSRTLLAQHM